MTLKVPLAAARAELPHPLSKRIERVPIPMIAGEHIDLPEGCPPLGDVAADQVPVLGFGPEGSGGGFFERLTAHQRHVVLPPGAEEYFASMRKQ